MIVSFTGHRPQKLFGYNIPNPRYNQCFKAVEDILLDLKPEKAISGMALGFDQLAVNVCIKLGIPFIAAVPFKGQEVIWPEKSKNIFNELLEQACEVVYVCSPGYAAWKMQKRNEWMVDNSDYVIGCWDGSFGGTKNCIEYAKKAIKKIVIINPKESFKISK